MHSSRKLLKKYCNYLKNTEGTAVLSFPNIKRNHPFCLILKFKTIVPTSKIKFKIVLPIYLKYSE